MKKMDLIHFLLDLDRTGIYVFPRGDIEKMFPNESEKALEKSLQRMVKDGLLQRPARGIYLNPSAHARKGWDIENIARALRPGCFNYVSLESILSEYGAISQIPVGRITVMTTGVGGEYNTPYGTIEFTHTKRARAALASRTLYVEGRPLRIATKRAAAQDLRRVGRNVNMLIDADADDDEQVGNGGNIPSDGKTRSGP